MRWYVGYPILAAGLAFGANTLFPSAPDFDKRPVNTEFETSALPEPAPAVMASDMEDQPVSRLAAFSPGDHFAAEQRPRSSVLDYLARTFTPLDFAPAAPAPAASTLQPLTVTAAWKSAIVQDAPASPQGAPIPTTRPVSRVALTRDIQRELKRMGCYHGEIDGVWGVGSKRAIGVFVERVNASLPTQEPDVFLLSLLKGQSESVCGASCPPGQSLTRRERCVPTTLAAQSGKTRSSSELYVVTEPVVAGATEPGPVPFGRMSIGGPKPADVEQLTPGWPQGASPHTGEHLERTAILEAGQADADTAVDPAPVRRAKSYSSRSRSARSGAPRRSSNNRHVQYLIQHPLGRM